MYSSKIAKIATAFLVVASASASAEMTAVATTAEFEKLGTVQWESNWNSYDGNTGPQSWYRYVYANHATFYSKEGFTWLESEPGFRTLVRANLGDTLVADFGYSEIDRFNLFSFKAASFGDAGKTTFLLETNLGNQYAFDADLSTPDNLSFYGFKFTGGEYISNLYASGNIGLTDVQLGNSPTISPVPEPATFALMGAGLAILGVARRREAKKA